MRCTLATLIVGLIVAGVNPRVKLIDETTVVGLGGGGVGIAVAAGCGGRCGSGRGCHHLALVIDILVWLIAIVASLRGIAFRHARGVAIIVGIAGAIATVSRVGSAVGTIFVEETTPLWLLVFGFGHHDGLCTSQRATLAVTYRLTVFALP